LRDEDNPKHRRNSRKGKKAPGRLFMN